MQQELGYLSWLPFVDSGPRIYSFSPNTELKVND